MPRHSETKHLPYTPGQLFDLVADVARYDEFLPWVVAVRVRSSSPAETVADLVVGFNAFKERFTSRVLKEKPSRICVDYVEGPLKYLHNEWKFEAAPDGGTNLGFSARCSTGRCGA
jgi:coenzyme Q-binding protein COQ10